VTTAGTAGAWTVTERHGGTRDGRPTTDGPESPGGTWYHRPGQFAVGYTSVFQTSVNGCIRYGNVHFAVITLIRVLRTYDNVFKTRRLQNYKTFVNFPPAANCTV